MPTFRFQAMDSAGEVHKDQIEAANADVIAGRTRRGVLAFGSDEQYSVTPLRKGSGDRGLFGSSLRRRSQRFSARGWSLPRRQAGSLGRKQVIVQSVSCHSRVSGNPSAEALDPRFRGGDMGAAERLRKVMWR